MPELPEVEHFRRLLLPLASSSNTLSFELTSEKPPRSFISKDDVAILNDKVYLTDVKRKGKLICMILTVKPTKKCQEQRFHYLFVHMGMTGRIATPTYVPKLESQQSTAYPPNHTHIVFKSGDKEACFSDPRKFGSMTLSNSIEEGFEELAPDAADVTDVLEKLATQKLAIKAVLLDQKRVMSGVGNWVADEVLYQSCIHPEQKYLSMEQAETIFDKIQEILSTAVHCLENGEDFPSPWIFHVRWSKRSSKKGPTVKDAAGRHVSFITAGGRTSAIVTSIQKLTQNEHIKKHALTRKAPGETKTTDATLSTMDLKPTKRALAKSENVPIAKSKKRGKQNDGKESKGNEKGEKPPGKEPKRTDRANQTELDSKANRRSKRLSLLK